MINTFVKAKILSKQDCQIVIATDQQKISKNRYLKVANLCWTLSVTIVV